MVSPQFCYQRALLAIIWLFVLWHLIESKPGVTTPPGAAQPKRKRSTEPKAFQGLTHKPHCVLCEQEAGETPPAPPRRPDPMPLTHRRPRAAVALHRVRRLFSRASWHDCSWQAGGGGTHRARLGLFG